MRKFTKKIGCSFLTATVLSIIPVALTAQEAPSKGPMSFSAFDKDKDGFISEAEHNSVREARQEQRASQNRAMRNVQNAPNFGEIDSDKDGKISKMEFLENQNKQMQENRSNKGSKNR